MQDTTLGVWVTTLVAQVVAVCVQPLFSSILQVAAVLVMNVGAAAAVTTQMMTWKLDEPGLVTAATEHWDVPGQAGPATDYTTITYSEWCNSKSSHSQQTETFGLPVLPQSAMSWWAAKPVIGYGWQRRALGPRLLLGLSPCAWGDLRSGDWERSRSSNPAQDDYDPKLHPECNFSTLQSVARLQWRAGEHCVTLIQRCCVQCDNHC